MTKRDQVGKGGMPTLTSTVINSEAYANPPKAPQKGAKSTLDSGRRPDAADGSSSAARSGAS